MAAHRYWRFNLPPRDISNGTLLAEVQFRTSIGGTNQATDPAKRTSPFGSLNNLFDGNNSTETYAFANGNSALSLWIAYDFTTPVEIVEAYIRSGTNGGLAPERIVVLYADVADRWQYAFPQGICGAMGASADFTHSGWNEEGFIEAGRAPAPSSLQSFPPSWPATPRGIAPAVMLVRAFWGGNGQIVGTVTIKGTPNTPVRRRVRLYREIDGVCVGEQWSDATTGAYSFLGFDRTITYTVLAYDGPRVFKATLADGVIPEIIP